MVKILSQAGDSLADIYDAKGSIAGIEDLTTRDLGIIHEMGATVFAERFTLRIGRMTGSFLQTTGFDLSVTGLPAAPTRILGVSVTTDVAARLTHCNVAVHSVSAGVEREVPIWTWDLADDIESPIRTITEGTLANRVVLRSRTATPNIPSMIQSIDELDETPAVKDIFFRGLTETFGAGTVNPEALVLIAFAQIGGVSSRGLPIPSW